MSCQINNNNTLIVHAEFHRHHQFTNTEIMILKYDVNFVKYDV
jgi:hypothetical protein